MAGYIKRYYLASCMQHRNIASFTPIRSHASIDFIIIMTINDLGTISWQLAGGTMTMIVDCSDQVILAPWHNGTIEPKHMHQHAKHQQDHFELPAVLIGAYIPLYCP